MTESEVKKIFSKFAKTNVLVIGDVMLDAYYFGKVSRISPEAPVPVVEINKKETRLGGAANVALNLVALDANVTLCGCYGNDDAGKQLTKLLKEHNIDASGMFVSKTRPTTIKTRVIGNNHQMIRIDEEVTNELSQSDKKIFTDKLLQIINSKKIDVIVFEDYDKGLLSADLISQIINTANDLKIPTVVDPKKNNFLSYKNVTLFKPNLKEIKEGLKIDFDVNKESELKAALKQLQTNLNCEGILLTLSEKLCIVKLWRRSIIPSI